MNELILMTHGSYESKLFIQEKFHTQYPDLSKAGIEKKLRFIALKEKRGTELRYRLFVTEEILSTYNIEKEAEKASQARFAEFMAEWQKAENTRL